MVVSPKNSRPIVLSSFSYVFYFFFFFLYACLIFIHNIVVKIFVMVCVVHLYLRAYAAPEIFGSSA